MENLKICREYCEKIVGTKKGNRFIRLIYGCGSETFIYLRDTEKFEDVIIDILQDKNKQKKDLRTIVIGIGDNKNIGQIKII